MAFIDKLIGIILIIVICFSTGWYYGAKYTDVRLSPEQIADNIEYIVFESKYSHKGILDNLKLNEIKREYRKYNMEGSNMAARMLLESLATRLCYKPVNEDWYLEEVEFEGNNVTINRFMECMFKNDLLPNKSP